MWRPPWIARPPRVVIRTRHRRRFQHREAIMKTLLFAIALPLTAGVIVTPGQGNDGRQCPASPVLLPVSALDRAAPQNNFCFDAGPPPLIGYLDPYATSKLIVWTP